MISKKYWNKKAQMSYLQILILIIATFAFAFLISPVFAQEWPAFNVCCEKTKAGAWCQNTLEENCASGFRSTPTSCEATSFCKPGCCYESSDGLCMENTPQKVCNDNEGTWLDDEECNIKQCELGCCVLGTQASFATLTRCKRLSGLYGLETNFRTDIEDEATCIAIAASQDQGACVFEEEFMRGCKFTTRGDCQNVQSTGNMSEAEFYKDYLCSAEELATECGPTSETMCVEGKDEVYFKDTCGNPANVYDASKKDAPAYWQKVIDKSESCGYGKDNANSKTCGNCDYFKGSICSKGQATYGRYICKDLNCYNTANGEDYKSGESWCEYEGEIGEGRDAAGSRQFRHVCIFGEETIEPCADFRNEMCLEGEIESEGEAFRESACRVNRWTNCVEQDEKEDCENTDKRDCFWVEGASFTKATGENAEESGISGLTYGGNGACVSDVPPGLKFWTDGDAQSVCNLGNSQCVVEYEKKLIGSKKCVKNCECLEESYAQKMNNICKSLGDCGAYVNIAGKFTDDGAEWKIGGNKRTISQGILGSFKPKIAGTLASQNLQNPISKFFKDLGVATGLVVVSGLELDASKLPIIGGLFGGDVIEGGGGLVDSASGVKNVKLTGEEFNKIWDDNQVIRDMYDEYFSGASSSGFEGEFTYDYDKSSGIGFKLGNKDLSTKQGVGVAKALDVDMGGAIKSYSIYSLPKDLKFGDALKSGTTTKLGANKLISVEKLADGNIKIQYEDPAGVLQSTQGKENQLINSVLKEQAGAGKGWGAISDYFTNNLLQNLLTAGAIGGLFSLIGSFIGGNAAMAGFFAGFGGTIAYQIASSAGKTVLGLPPSIFGIGVGAAIFILMYKKESKEIVEFNCLPWQAPVGGGDCELCNKNEMIGCSEYRCKSLGQACELLNAGTEQEACTWVNPHDVSSPKISIGDISEGYKWIPDTAVRPPATGVVISERDGSCVEAFTGLEFNLVTNEPSQCKIDYNLTRGFEEMSYYVGGTDLFSYNHTETMSLPGPDAINKAAPELQNDGTYTLYARCQDANGNFNQDAFSVRFCVEAGPDTTPPRIEDLSIPSGSPLQYNKTNLELEVYVNEPAECKWSREDRIFDNMENSMGCSTNLWEMNNRDVYTCKTTLTGIEDRKENKYYFRCKDNPNELEENRNVNTQSYLYKIIGTQPLNILEIGPNGTIYGSTDVIPVFLKVETDNGYNNGQAFCYYSTTGEEDDYIQFAETDASEHEQRQDLATGDYTYYYKCVDLGGNAVYNSTKFRVETDRTAPVIVRAYKEGELKIITNEDSTCSYSNQNCNFNIEDGIDMPYAEQTSHLAEWKTSQTYYIRCRDEYNNQPNPNTCSMIVRPYETSWEEDVIEL